MESAEENGTNKRNAIAEGGAVAGDTALGDESVVGQEVTLNESGSLPQENALARMNVVTDENGVAKDGNPSEENGRGHEDDSNDVDIGMAGTIPKGAKKTRRQPRKPQPIMAPRMSYRKMVKNFQQDSNDQLTLFGASNAVTAFQDYVGQGYYLHRPSAIESEIPTILTALNSSLESIHGLNSQRLAYLQFLKKKIDIDMVAEAHDMTLDVMLEQLEDKPAYLVPSFVPPLLHELGISDGENYQLGYVGFSREINGYGVVLIPGASRRPPTTTLWIYSEPGFGKSHESFSGFCHELVSAANLANKGQRLTSTGFRVMHEVRIPSTAAGRGSLTSVEATASRAPASVKSASKANSDVGKESKESGIYVKGLPRSEENLPWPAMGGITGKELLTFFPNHSLRWPAICARLIEDGWTSTTITNVFKQLVADGSDDAELKSNTLGYSIKKSCARFYSTKDWTYRNFIKQAEWRSPADREAITNKLGTTPWEPLPSDRYGSSNLVVAGTSLKQLGLWFFNMHGSIPCDGEFTFRVLRATLQGGDPSTTQANSSTNLYFRPVEGTSYNPPRLPVGWVSDLSKPSNEMRLSHVDTTSLSGNSSQPQSLEVTKLRSMDKSSTQLREEMPVHIRDDPSAIIRAYPSAVNGELLLWMLSKNGGKQTVGGIVREFNHVYGISQTKRASILESRCSVPDRSTFSYRKKAAIRKRATLYGKEYEEELRLFDTNEAFQPRPAPSERNGLNSTPGTSSSAGNPDQVQHITPSVDGRAKRASETFSETTLVYQNTESNTRVDTRYGESNFASYNNSAHSQSMICPPIIAAGYASITLPMYEDPTCAQSGSLGPYFGKGNNTVIPQPNVAQSYQPYAGDRLAVLQNNQWVSYGPPSSYVDNSISGRDVEVIPLTLEQAPSQTSSSNTSIDLYQETIRSRIGVTEEAEPPEHEVNDYKMPDYTGEDVFAEFTNDAYMQDA